MQLQRASILRRRFNEKCIYRRPSSRSITAFEPVGLEKATWPRGTFLVSSKHGEHLHLASRRRRRRRRRTQPEIGAVWAKHRTDSTFRSECILRVQISMHVADMNLFWRRQQRWGNMQTLQYYIPKKVTIVRFVVYFLFFVCDCARSKFFHIFQQFCSDENSEYFFTKICKDQNQFEIRFPYSLIKLIVISTRPTANEAMT